MAVSRNTGNRQGISFWERLFGQLSRYDLLLAAIPLLFVLSLVASVALAIPLHVAIIVGSVVSLALVADGLYFNPPVDARAEPSADPSMNVHVDTPADD